MNSSSSKCTPSISRRTSSGGWSSRFTLTHVVVVSSLDPGDVDTAAHVAEIVASHAAEDGSAPRVSSLQCASADEFRRLVKGLIELAHTLSFIPLLHIDCHGSKAFGLEFADGSLMDWPELARVLVPLNIACEFNLVVVCGVCDSTAFLGTFETSAPAPCYALVSSTQTVLEYEVLAGMRAFYLALFERWDFGDAVRAIRSLPLTCGRWHCQLVELGFVEILVGYHREHCTPRLIRERSARIAAAFKADGKQLKVRDAKRIVIATDKASAAQRFEQFFAIEQLPHNRNRFAAVLEMTEQRVAALKA